MSGFFSKERNDLRKDAILNTCNRVKENTKEFISNNKELCTSIAVTTFCILVKAISCQTKKHQIEEQRELKENYCYDNRLGMYWQLKREMSNSERLELEWRKERGEKTGEILRDMRILK